MRYSVRAALTTALVGFFVLFLTNDSGLGAIAAVAVMGAYILEAGNQEGGPKHDEDVPKDNLKP